jgi:hypothetical protein
MKRIWLSTALFVMCAAAAVVAQPRTSYFAFTTDDFWLNLHHYLYVLGRAHNNASDAKEPAVASAPDDEKQGLSLLSEEERQSWAVAVDSYARGVSQNTSFFQPPLATMTISLAKTGDVPDFPVTTWKQADRETLERAAPAYRKAWWPRHRAMNERYVAELQRSIDRDGPAIVAYLGRVYGLEWPSRPYPTHVVAYSIWQGAFSYTGRLLILSSNPNEQNDRFYPLELAFHEAMHQWDDKVSAMLRAQATARGVAVPVDLSHTLVFATTGEAVRRIHPEHVPVIDARDIWSKPLSGSRLPAKRLQPAIQEVWKPYLAGRGSRDEALNAIVAATAAATP